MLKDVGHAAASLREQLGDHGADPESKLILNRETGDTFTSAGLPDRPAFALEAFWSFDLSPRAVLFVDQEF